MVFDRSAQLGQAGVVVVLQVEVGPGGPKLDGPVPQPLGRFQEVIQGVALVVVVGGAELVTGKHGSASFRFGARQDQYSTFHI